MMKLTIRAKLITFVVAAVVAALGAVGSLSFLFLASQTASQELVGSLQANAHASQDLVGNAAKLHDVMLRLLREKDIDKLEALLKDEEAVEKDTQSRVRGNPPLESALSALSAANTKAKDALLKGEAGQANELFIAESNPAFQKLLQSIDASQTDALKALDESGRQGHARLRGVGTAVGLVVTLVVVVLAVGGLLLTRGINSAFRQIVERVQDVAQGDGDLTKRLPTTSGDEFAQLSTWFNTFMEKLHRIMTEVKTHTTNLACACEEMAAGTVEQARTMDAQRGQSDQVAAAMQEISVTVGDVSRNTQEAAQASHNAAEIARDGGAVVEKAISQMHAIAESVGSAAERVQSLGMSSDRIGQIVAVIDDIADQTNLLALNAAIEAARAGEQGRGFAVVADEVRKLAERTGKATKEISDLISQIQSETSLAVSAMHTGTSLVDQGVEATRKAGDSLAGIIEMSERVGSMISQIATAATQQSASTEDVSTNIAQISQMTAEVAETAAQSAKSVTDLSTLAVDLQGLVENFKLS